jgi:opacity protein-like surface antigen
MSRKKGILVGTGTLGLMLVMSQVAFSQTDGDPANGTPPVGSGSSTPANSAATTEAPPPPPPPPPTPSTPPTDTAPPPAATAPTPTPTPPPGPSGGMTDLKPVDHRPPEQTIGLEFGAGLASRLSNSPTGLPFESRHSLGYHVGFFGGISRLVSVGVHFNHLNAGTEAEEKTVRSMRIQRDINAFMAELRLFPFRKDRIRLFVGLMAGLGWERVDVSGTTPSTNQAATALPIPFRCDGSGNVGLGLGLGAGVSLDLGKNMQFMTRVSGTNYFVGDSPAGNCVSGGGTTTILGVTSGLQFRFDLSPKSTK